MLLEINERPCPLPQGGGAQGHRHGGAGRRHRHHHRRERRRQEHDVARHFRAGADQQGRDRVRGQAHRRACRPRRSWRSASPMCRKAAASFQSDGRGEPAHRRLPALATRPAIEKDLDEVFEHFPRLKERRKQWARSLSGGEQQMLAIGRALMSRPKMLVLDEPSMGLVAGHGAGDRPHHSRDRRPRRAGGAGRAERRACAQARALRLRARDRKHRAARVRRTSCTTTRM